ncbi:glycine N-acyltransferase-like [Aulostomus maculatus]
MIILNTVEDLMMMKNILLDELPQAISVFGGLLHILHKNSCHLEICVDSWPKFTTVICFRQEQDPEVLKTMLLNERVVRWKHGLKFRGVPTKYGPVIKELATLRGFDTKDVGNCDVFMHYAKEKPQKERETHLTISTLDESHAELVDKCLEYGGSEANLNYVRACIRHLPNSCVLNERGQPVSWMLSDELGELRMAFTLPEYRHAGHFQALGKVLCYKMGCAGLPIFCHIKHDNKLAINIAESNGFTGFPNVGTVYLHIICQDRQSKQN